MARNRKINVKIEEPTENVTGSSAPVNYAGLPAGNGMLLFIEASLADSQISAADKETVERNLIEISRNFLQTVPEPSIKDIASPPRHRKLAAVPEQKNPSKWTKQIAPKQEEKIKPDAQRYEMLVGFCHTYLQLKEIEEKFQENMRDFLNKEVEELKDNPISAGTPITFRILGKSVGKSTSVYFEWTQDGKRKTETIGIARYLNQIHVTNIPR